MALAAARANRPLPDGSVIVVVNRDASGAATSYAAMASQAGWGETVPALLRNGNWDFAVFDAAHVRNARLNQAVCLACHRPQAPNSFCLHPPALRAGAAAGRLRQRLGIPAPAGVALSITLLRRGILNDVT